MITSKYDDKGLIVDILTSSFRDNKSVNYIIKRDADTQQRLRNLMNYSFEICHLFGSIFLSDNKKSCALILFPDKKKSSLKSIKLDLKLIFNCVGLANVSKALKREAKIKKLQPEGLLYYIWFIGVYPDHQHNGIGSALLAELISDASSEQRTMCLETSTLSNISWYESFGFKVYNELDLGYTLYFLKRE